jgi:hypothetical protein
MTARARHHWELSRELYAELGNPAASDIDSLLAGLSRDATRVPAN